MVKKPGRAASPFEDGEVNSLRKYLFRLFERGYEPGDALKALKIKLRCDTVGDAGRRRADTQTKRADEAVARGARERRNADE